jgi:hypothetical protein
MYDMSICQHADLFQIKHFHRQTFQILYSRAFYTNDIFRLNFQFFNFPIFQIDLKYIWKQPLAPYLCRRF